ncbi:CRISPR-associated protein, TM1812 family [Oscillochloris trichoides DG-6]|uniref:CRISPR-associated protein, TM1812 family n=1 Tax=Oscillochloris trichoides DG-6 TaxID=765420 RepID=E1IGD2_9CHLR|nr:TIGR02221 family CRISPR-associated protein [Oscillochloris trichoides]EFO79698.1 CRISPR-associated protein, TM1812 family [Oscillochloris trichoides DG-6]
MTTRAISFLGAGNLSQTTYYWGDHTCSTHFMAEATVRIFKPDQLHVIVTKEAREKHLNDLMSRVEGILPVFPVDIPSGRSEEELWAIFAAIAGVIEDDDTIIIDITNAFRSIPMMALLAAAFVRVVRKATVERIIYGAFEAKQDNITPIFDLTSFVNLLDWTNATDSFLRYGRADQLSQLASVSNSHSPLPPIATDLSDHLKTLTNALQTVRPIELMRSAQQVEHLVSSSRNDVSTTNQPIRLLLDQIAIEYGQFGLQRPRHPNTAPDLLKRKLRMIGWYLDKGLAVHAITLAREWLISLVLVRVGGDMFCKEHREDAEKLLNGYSSPIAKSALPDYAQLYEIWQKIRKLRNDVAHAGMRSPAASAETVISDTSKLCKQLDHLLLS